MLFMPFFQHNVPQSKGSRKLICKSENMYVEPSAIDVWQNSGTGTVLTKWPGLPRCGLGCLMQDVTPPTHMSFDLPLTPIQKRHQAPSPTCAVVSSRPRCVSYLPAARVVLSWSVRVRPSAACSARQYAVAAPAAPLGRPARRRVSPPPAHIIDSPPPRRAAAHTSGRTRRSRWCRRPSRTKVKRRIVS